MITLGEVTIGRDKCYLLQDSIAATVPESAVAVQDCEGGVLFYPRAELARVRKITSLSIYGVWQVLVASGVLAKLDKDGRYVIYLNADRSDGQTLVFNSGRPQTDSIRFVADHADFQPLNVADDCLVLPDTPLLSPAEQIRREQRQRRKRLSRYSVLSLLAVAAYLAGDTWSQIQTENMAARIKVLKHENQVLRENLNRFERQPQLKSLQLRQLAPLLYFAMHDVEVEADRVVTDQAPYRLKLPSRKVPQDAFADVNVTAVRYLNDGTTDVFWE